MAIQRVILTDSRKRRCLYEEAIKTSPYKYAVQWCRDKEYCSHKLLSK